LRGILKVPGFVDSDPEENVETSVSRPFDQPRNRSHVLPLPIDNQGVEVYFRGLAIQAEKIGCDKSGGY
jgi:hypothetical protein